MSSNRHLSRIIALQSLFEHEFRSRAEIEGLTSDVNQIFNRNLEVYKDNLSDDGFARDLVEGTIKNQTKEDELIAPAAPEWPIEQIAKMDLTILRLAVYELMMKHEVPPKVVINEAVELAKSFGGDNSSKFINGVLGTIYRQSKFYDPTEDHKVQREQGQNQSDVEPDPKSGSESKPESGQPKASPTTSARRSSSRQVQTSQIADQSAVNGKAESGESDSQVESDSESGQAESVTPTIQPRSPDEVGSELESETETGQSIDSPAKPTT